MTHTTKEQKMWAIYCDPPRLLVDCIDEGDDDSVSGAVGSNWQPGYSETEAKAFVAEHLEKGWNQGHYWAPRF